MIIFDIETLPCTNEALIDRLTGDLQPPANYKTPEAIEKWMDDAKFKATNDTSLNGAYGSIACIAWINDEINDDVQSTNQIGEANCLDTFFNAIGNEKIFCGHNVSGFDLQFIKHRSIIHGIKPPQGLLYAMNAKPWDDCIKDTMLMWSRSKMISLSTLAWILGIDNPNDFNGSEVAKIWAQDPQKVIDKCIADVQMTYEVYNRLMFNNSVF